jgi:dCTP deaminase
MVLTPDTIKLLKIITPFRERYVKNGLSGGSSHVGYDIALGQSISVPELGFTLAVSLEEFNIPKHVMGVVHDKSTWARKGIFCGNTILEPGWKGYLTLEIMNHDRYAVVISKETPIAQIIFHTLSYSVAGYTGKYQSQGPFPQEAIMENE